MRFIYCNFDDGLGDRPEVLWKPMCVRDSCLARNDSVLAICKSNIPHSVYRHARVE